MTTEISSKQQTALAPKASPEAITELEQIAAQCRVIQHDVATEFQKTFALAAAKRRLSELISNDMMEDIMRLQGSPIGFTTDRDADGKTYPVEVVKEVAIEATLRGLRMYGNEVVIISGRLYGAQSGVRRLVMEFPGVTNVRIDIREPIRRAEYALVPCIASYALDGEVCTVDCLGDRAIPVRVNKNMIVDAILGKAKRKLFARIYDSLTGLEHGLVESDTVIDVKTTDAMPSACSATQDDLPEGYVKQIKDAQNVREVGDVAKTICGDPTLSAKAKADGTRRCTERSKAIRDGRGERSNSAMN